MGIFFPPLSSKREVLPYLKLWNGQGFWSPSFLISVATAERSAAAPSKLTWSMSEENKKEEHTNA